MMIIYILYTVPGSEIEAENKDGHDYLDLTDNVFNERPDMVKLRHLELPKSSDGKKRPFDVAERIADSYKEVGGELLQDLYGNKVEIKHTDNNFKLVNTNVAILKKWLEGDGKKPVTWRILIQVLDKHGLAELAQDIRKALLYIK
jgi:hypothetical protein